MKPPAGMVGRDGYPNDQHPDSTTARLTAYDEARLNLLDADAWPDDTVLFERRRRPQRKDRPQ